MYASGVKASGGGFDSYCKAQQNAAITAVTSTWTKSPFEGVEFDGLGEVDYTTNKRWVAAADGVYRILAVASIKGMPNTAGVGMAIKIYKNGSVLIESGWEERGCAGVTLNGLGQDGPAIHETAVSLSAGDYIEIYVWHNSGVGKLIEGPNYCVIQRIA